MSYKKNSPRENGQFKNHVDYSHIKDNEFVKKWLENVNSKRPRLSILNRFCNFLDKTPTEIIMDHANDIRQKNPLDIKDIAKKQLKAFFGYLTGTEEDIWKNTLNDKKIPVDDRVSWNSAIEYMHSKLSSFYKRNNVPIIWQKGEVPEQRKGTMEKTWKNGTKRIAHINRKETIIEIRNGLKLTRDRAILLSIISSGMDGVDLFKLKVKDFNDGYREEYNICYIYGVRQKIKRKGIVFQTFFNSEACELINTYLKTRPDKTSKTFEESWLFISNRKINGEYTQLKNQFADNLKDACVKLNIMNVTPKSFRRWFKTELSRCEVRKEYIKRLMGHKLDVEGGSYESTFEDIDEGTEFDKIYAENIEQYTLLENGGRKYGKVDKRVEKLEEHIEDLKQITRVLFEMQKESERIDEKHGIESTKAYKEMFKNFEDRFNKLYSKKIDKE